MELINGYVNYYLIFGCIWEVRVTKNGSAFIPGNAQRFITNLVRENYRQDIEDGKVTTEKCKCRLYIRAYVSGATGTLHGMWSPDSVGSCKVANP